MTLVTRDIAAFLSVARAAAPGFGPPTARAVFLVAPDGFRLADQSARDNRYMAAAATFDGARASDQHRALQRALSASVPAISFAGDPGAPDGLFPNNVFATVPGRYLVGRMRHPVRQREAARGDIRAFFRDVLGYAEADLSAQPHPCELTGAMVVDRVRGLGFCGLSERCDAEGARLVHEAMGLRATLLFDLAPGEYHANVVLAVLAGRAVLACPDGFADPAVVDAIADLYAPHAILLDAGEKAAFAGNAIALAGDQAWMSEGAAGGTAPGEPRCDRAGRVHLAQRRVGCDRGGGRIAALLRRGGLLTLQTGFTAPSRECRANLTALSSPDPMSFPRSRNTSLLLLALAMVAPLGVAAQARDVPRQANERPSEHRALSDAVRRVERATNGQVLSAERVQFDGRDVNRVKIIDDRGRVRVYWDDPQRAERRDEAARRAIRPERAASESDERSEPPRRDDPPRRTRRHDGAAFNL